ncbi:unnamed protein product [Effrenium voratum]|nr:unnamed protein product [Effrenium voratum]
MYKSLGMSGVDVAGIYNPERFTSKANAFGLQPGFAIDLTLQKDDKGNHWDLSKTEHQKKLKGLLWKEKPAFLIGSPPCGPFSPLQNLSSHRRTAAQNEAILAEGRLHLNVAAEAYMEQHRNGRYFLHEHPKPSRSWREPRIEKLQAMDGVYTVQAPMCKCHMKAEDGQGVGLVRKETCYVTNSAEMAKALEGRCEGRHRHVHLINGRAREAQVYPPKLVNAILKGIKKELMNKGETSELSSITAGPSPDKTSSEPTEHFFNPDVQTEGVFFHSALKVLCSLLVSKKVSKSGQPLKLRLIDISRAHFYGQARRRVFCNLPEGEEIAGKCALLKRSMYGALDAASIWQQTYADVLKKNNVKQCVAWPALFYQKDSDLRFMVHGDDFISLGDDSAQN